MKLTPARRVVLLIAIILLIFPATSVHTAGEQLPRVSINVPFTLYGGLLILLVLILEVADRVSMKRDLEIAREIQLSLVPDHPPEIPHLELAFTTRPANTVAGDYYDVIIREANGATKSLLVVADVVGKSIPAAMLMATFQASLRALWVNCTSLLDLAQQLNRYHAAAPNTGRSFTTAFVAEFDSGSRTLHYVNAGHNAPAVRRANSIIERLETGGLPFGVLAEAQYCEGATVLAPGDVLVIFTDGLSEAENLQQQEFGEDRLMTSLQHADGTAGEILAALFQSVNAFVATAPQHDDQTCLVARCV
jgi:serine phosphatase RsbU (regulator of sigma subunit)